MNTKCLMKSSLLAPCGINCSVCIAYQREKNKCPGCKINSINKAITRTQCKIKNCNELHKNKIKFCFKCDKFPCKKIKKMDKRYQTRYNMSTIKNLKNIKKCGIKKFIAYEKIKWTCSNCGTLKCVHKAFCTNCGKKE